MIDREERAKKLDEAHKKLTKDGIKYVQIETPDLDGGLRGKFVSLDKGLSASGSAFCTILYGLTVADDVFESEHSSFDNGFPDMFAIPDPDTIVPLPSTEATAAVICDACSPEGDYYPMSPRSVLRKAIAGAADLGYDARFGVEYEAFVFERDDTLTNAARHNDLTPLSPMWNAYSLVRMVETRDLAKTFMERMNEAGMSVDAVHTELGFGMVEIALSHAPPLEAADQAARAKLYFRELCRERGLTATFMAKWREGESGSGGHIHQSLWRDGKPAFAGDRHGLSEVGRSYVAGLVEHLVDFAPVFYPNVNSYRRMDAGAWSPENASWGTDNRTAAVRVITQPSSKAVRAEHRAPGADANPYLTIAAMLAGGTMGVSQKLELGEPAQANASTETRFKPLPRTLPDATSAFASSTAAKIAFGEEFVAHYALSRRQEWDAWTRHLGEQTTPWEHMRYFDTV
jgi:glutamine synthetase